MRKLLEFKVFDLLKDPEIAKFLAKVKKETPDEYARFISLVGNKGLEIAKKKYEPYDPEYIKRIEEQIKKERLEKKRQKSKEYKQEKKEEFLEEYADEIKEINNVLLKSELKIIAKKIQQNSRISTYLRNCGAKKQYENNFIKILKSNNLRSIEYDIGHIFTIDTLKFVVPTSLFYDNEQHHIIQINQQYDQRTKKLTYHISFSMIGIDEFSLKEDDKRSVDFIWDRNDYICGLTNFNNLGKKELYEIIFEKFSGALSDEFYEEWLLKRDANKYNL